MKIKVIRELAFRFIDNEMEGESEVAFTERIAHCPDCARETRFARIFLTVVRERCHREHAPRALRRKILLTLPHRQRQDAE